MSRNKCFPLYLWIKSHGSILNIKPSSNLGLSLTGNHLVREVALKYLCLHKSTTVEKFNEIVGALVVRYNTRYCHLSNDLNRAIYTTDKNAEVYVVHSEHCDEIYTRESETHAREQKRKHRQELRRKKEALIQRAEVDPTVVVVNRLNEEWVKQYYEIGVQKELPSVLQGIHNIHEIPAAHPPGVYILMHGEEVVYVGQSINPSTRLGQHTKDKIFDKAYLIPTENRLAVEAEYIQKYRPKYNVMGNTA
jgi:hypothetical protein